MSNINPEIIDGLLIKVILREATEEEASIVEGWARASDVNHRYFEDFKRIWNQARGLAMESEVDEDEAWKRFRRRVDSGGDGDVNRDRTGLGHEGAGVNRGGAGSGVQGEIRGEGAGRVQGNDMRGDRGAFADKEIQVAGGERRSADENVDPGRVKRMTSGWIVAIRWVGVAAVFLMLAIGGWMYFRHSDQATMQFALQSEGGVLRDTLEDGTVVTLNKHSSLKGLTHFTSTERVVELEGEGFFEVASDKSRPFSVRTKDAVIRVLGTSFNVRSSGEQTEVIVETGRVVVGKESQLIPLKAQERVVITSAGASVEGSHDELYNYYRTKAFVCNGTPLGRLVEVLNAAYGARIEVADSSLAKLPLTTTFQDGSLDEILQIVSKTLKLTIDKKEGRIILK